MTRHLPIIALAWLAVAVTELATPTGGFWTTDDAVHLIQVENILRVGVGDQAIDWPGQDVDPELEFAPLVPPVGHVVGGRLYVGFAPFYPMLAAPFYATLGMAGIRLLGLAFLLVLLLGVRDLAEELAPPGRIRGHAPPLAVAAVALATPVWFYSLTFWEHVPACAVVVWGVLLTLRAVRSGSAITALTAGVLFGTGTYLREAVAFMAVGAVVLLFLNASAKRVPIAFTLALAISILPLCVFNEVHFGSVLGLHLQPDSPIELGWSEHIGDRFHVIWALLFSLHRSELISVLVALPLIGLLFTRPMLSTRHQRVASVALPCVGIAVAAIVLVDQSSSADPIRILMATNGFWAGAPLIIVALVARSVPTGTRYWKGERIVWLLVVIQVALYLLLAPLRHSTGMHWGCRYLLETVPLLGVLSSLALARLWSFRPVWLGRALVISVLASGVALQLYSVDLVRERRAYSAELNAVVERSAGSAVVTDSWNVPQELAHVFFSKPVFLTSGSDTARLRRALEAHGHENVVFVAPPPPDAEARGVSVVGDGLGFETLGIGVIGTRE